LIESPREGFDDEEDEDEDDDEVDVDDIFSILIKKLHGKFAWNVPGENKSMRFRTHISFEEISTIERRTYYK